MVPAIARLLSNCADYNKWTEAQKLAHLRNSLETVGLWKGNYRFLERSYGNTGNQIRRQGYGGEIRLELRNRRRSADETLQSLHSDVRRLAALAYNGMPSEIRDPVTCDHFLNALGDPELSLIHI